MEERIQKILSARGICSRRKAEEYILQGLIKVNGKPAILGQKADPETDTIEVDGKVIEERQHMLYYLMNKPEGIVTSNVENRESLGQTIRDLLPLDLKGKIYPVGRLDKDSSGLLLLTNDGVLAFRLTHPKFDHEKEYEVMVESPITDGALRKLRDGLMILGTKTKHADVVRITTRKFSMALTEGRNRQIRRMCQKIGNPVVRLRRTRIVTLRDSSLDEGEIRPLTPEEVKRLLQSVGI